MNQHATALECLRRQTDELDGLFAIYNDEAAAANNGQPDVTNRPLRVVSADTPSRLIEDILAERDASKNGLEKRGYVLEYRLQIGDLTLGAAAKEVSADCQESGCIILTVSVPVFYPESSQPCWIGVASSSASMTLSDLATLERCVQEIAFEWGGTGTEHVLQLIQSFETEVDDMVDAKRSAMPPDGSAYRGRPQVPPPGDESSDGDDTCETHIMMEQPAPPSSKSTKVVLGRRLCYSHHIRSPIKRDLIMQWAVELQLSGVSRIGYPGIVVVEGPEENCKMYVRCVQRLRWKHFVVRGEQIVEGEAGQRIDDLRTLPKGFIEFGPGGDSMSKVAQVCRDAGLEELFLTSMKIYSKDRGDRNSKNQRRAKTVAKD